MMNEPMFRYEVKGLRSSIIDTTNFVENSDEAKILCLLFGGLLVTKNSEQEMFQTRNYFLLGDDTVSNVNVLNNFRLMQSNLQKLKEDVITDFPTQAEEFSASSNQVLSMIGTLLNEESFISEQNFDDFMLEEFSLDESNGESLKKYFNYMRRQNKDFQSTLLFEITMFFFKSEVSPTTAFLHLYRVLELICFNIPLVYTSKEVSYVGAYTKLKKFFSKSGGEFVFFKSFLKTLFKDEEEVLTQSFEFVVKSDDVSKIKDDLNRVYSLDNVDKNGNKFWNFRIIDEGSLAECTITFENLIDFVVNLRNRYFHLSDGSGNPNIKNKTYEMDHVFVNLNYSLMNCLAIILLSVAKHGFSSYSRLVEIDIPS